MGVAEWAGMAAGVAAAPAIALAVLVRRRRLFHPKGAYYGCAVTPVADGGDAGKLAHRLAGRALLRVSGGAEPLHDRRRDLVGFTVRFHGDDSDGLQAREGDQDLLFATLKGLGTLGRDLRSTNTRNLLDNRYNTASPAHDVDMGPVTFRLLPQSAGDYEGEDGPARLDAAIAAGEVVLDVEVRRLGTGEWIKVVEIRPETRLEGVDTDTRFSPFLTGRGIVPTGFVAGVRRVAYAVGPAMRRAPALLADR